MLKQWVRDGFRAAGVELRKIRPNDDAAFGGRVYAVEHDGVKLRFFVNNTSDLIQVHHHHGRIYEPEELAIIAAHCPKGGTLLDGGANVGNHAVFLARKLGLRRIVAFEPGHEQSILLRMNIALNQLSPVIEVVEKGLSETQGQATMVLKSFGNLGSMRIGEANEEGVVSSEEIDLVRADEFWRHERCGFVKLDVEGHEAAALRGMEAILVRDKPPVFVEVFDAHADEVRQLLTGFGYRPEQDFGRYTGIRNYLWLHPDGERA